MELLHERGKKRSRKNEDEDEMARITIRQEKQQQSYGIEETGPITLVARIGRRKTGIGMDMDLERYKIATDSPPRGVSGCPWRSRVAATADTY